MAKKCNRIVITSNYGWGAHPQSSDILTIFEDHIVYDLKVERMGELVETSNSKLFFNKRGYLLLERSALKLLGFASSAKFEVEKDFYVCDGGSISMTIYYEDGAERVIDAPGEELQYACADLYEFFKMLSAIIRGSSIRPIYLDSDEIECVEENDDD